MKAIYVLIAILLGVNNVFIRFKIGSISYDRLLEFLIFFLFFRTYLNEIKINPFFKKFNSFLLLFALLQLLMNLRLTILGEMLFEDVYKELFKCLSFLVYAFLFLLIAKKSLKYVDVILYVHLFICLFAFLQHPISPISAQMLEIKKLLYVMVENEGISTKLNREEVYIEGGFGDRFRLSGPFVSTINFSYFAISSLAISMYMYLRLRKKFYLIIIAMLLVASVLTQTRSLLLGEIVLIFGFLFFVPVSRHALYKLGLVICTLLMVTYVLINKDFLNSGSRITTLGSGGEGDSRPYLWITGVYAVSKHPLGITEYQYKEARKEMYYLIGHPAVLFLAPHHGLINLGLHYSFFGYILFFFFTLFLLRQIRLLEPKYVLFFRLVLIAYLIHGSFHNDFILNADYPFLMVLILIYIDKYYFLQIKNAKDNHFKLLRK